MRDTNPLRESLAADETVYGARASTMAPAAIETYGDLGLDFAWLDLEHAGPSAADAAALDHLARAAEAAGTELLVRLPSGDPELVRKVLDTGVRTVLVPRVDGPGDVAPAARAARFEYGDGVGDRGVAHGRGTRWGDDVDLAREDETVMVGAMLESAAARENAADVLAVDGVDFAYLGPGDLAVSLGHGAAVDHPDVQAAVDDLLAACEDAGVPFGRSVETPEAAREARDRGYRLVRVGDELGAVRRHVRDCLDHL